MIADQSARSLNTEPGRLPVKCVDQIGQLDTIHGKETEAAIWVRALPASVEAWLDKLALQNLPEARIVLKPGDVFARVSALFADAGLTACPAQSWLCNDIAELARFVSRADCRPLVRLRLETITGDACSRFHIDYVRSRLICTYRGPGTQISQSSSGDQPVDISDVPTGAPILLKGKLWPRATNLSLMHRSPPIAGTGVSRFVIVLEGCTKSEIVPAYDEH